LGCQVRDLAISVTAGAEYDQVVAMYSGDARNPATHKKENKLPSREAVRDWATSRYSVIPDWFGSFATGNPSACDTVVQDLWKVAATLENNVKIGNSTDPSKLRSPQSEAGPVEVSERVSDLSKTLGEWHGSAATSFQTHFVTPLESSGPAQGWLAESLAVTMDANKAIREHLNDDIWNIGQSTIQALNKIGHNCTGNNVLTAITVMAAMTSLIISIPEGGAGAIGGLKYAIGASSNVGTVLKSMHGEKTQKTIGGGSVDATIMSMKDAMNTLTSDYGLIQSRLIDVVHQVASTVQQSHHKFEAPKPTSVVDIRDTNAHDLASKDIFTDG
jgi:hypothetical protein